MFRRLCAIFVAILAALAGAMLGKKVADMRRQSQARDEADTGIGDALVRPRDVIPGLVAALRVRDRPWSYLHIPSWLAAFSVNFAFAAGGRELGPLLRALRGEGNGAPMYRDAEDPMAWGVSASASGATPPESTAEFHPL